MAYVPTTFVDRSVEFPNRRKLTAVSGQADTFDVARAEGTVFAAGTKLDAANLNAEFGKIKTELDAKKYFIDTSNIISSIKSDADWVNATRTIAYTATQDCSINDELGAMTLGNTNIHINDVLVSRIGCDTASVFAPCNFLLKSGDTIKFIANGNTFFIINAFGLK